MLCCAAGSGRKCGVWMWAVVCVCAVLICSSQLQFNGVEYCLAVCSERPISRRAVTVKEEGMVVVTCGTALRTNPGECR